MSQSPVVNYCIVCEQLVNPDDEGREDKIKVYTDGPCMKCRQEMKDGNFLFVVISDKSDEDRINRLHHTAVVDEEEVIKEYGNLDRFNGERVVFIPESEAIEVGILEERITDPDTGIRYDQLEDNNAENKEV